jgi:hypothetical protein
MHTEGLAEDQTESAQHGAPICLQIPSLLCPSEYRKFSPCGDGEDNGHRAISPRSTAGTPVRMCQGDVRSWPLPGLLKPESSQIESLS